MDNFKTLQDHLNEAGMTSRLAEMVEDSLNEADMLCEMAEIGKFGKLIIYVWTRDGGEIPHFHIGDAVSFPRCSHFSTAIKIESAEYFPHGGKYTHKLNSKQRKELMKFLNSTDEFGDTAWKLIKQMWNKGISSHKVKPTLPLPDYTKLK